MTDSYTDRHGQTHKPGPGSMVMPRHGIFLIAVERGHMLLTWQHGAIDTPQLPGGGIEKGEDKLTALSRECWEEAGIRIGTNDLRDLPELSRLIGFYNDSKNEFWDYRQSYILLRDSGLPDLWFEEERKSPEDGAALWVALERIDGLNIQAVHKIAIDAMLKS